MTHDNDRHAPRVLSSARLAKWEDGQLVVLVLGSLSEGRPRYEVDADITARVQAAQRAVTQEGATDAL